MSIYSVEDIARVCHDANRALCLANGDNTQQPWDAAHDWQRQSSIDSVKFVIEHPDAPESALHDAWMAEKLAAGWTYGPIKDSAKRVHNCLVPFAELAAHQQTKDRLFIAVVKALAE